MTRRFLSRLLLTLSLALAPLLAAAQGGLDAGNVVGNPSALPIAVVPMPYQGAGPAPETDIAGVVRADLNRSGQFNSLAEERIRAMFPNGVLPTRGSELRMADWQITKRDFVVVGRVLDTGDGGYKVEYELYDVAKQERLLGLALTGRGKGLRDVAHQIADQIYEKILGVRGAFWTRIAYVTQSGVGPQSRYALMVADSDGFNPQPVTRSGEPLLSPAWSPDGKRLAYVSFERGNSTIYVQEINTGAREVVASFKGINGAPAFSPDGRRLAMTLSKGGNPEIYVMDLGTKALTQVTRHFGIDTEAVWTAEGNLIFTSDRAGKPQLYQVSAGGGEPARISFGGDSNAKASVSFDGKKVAAAQGNGNVYRIAVLDRGFGGAARWQTLSPGSLDESPSFAPNASMLLYAAKEGRRGVLWAVSADGRVRQRLVLADGDVREPAWSPYRQR